ncbi:MAG: CHAT domain-containing protein [Oscillatoria princeps RMCB-10]|nr:CHAT domain-containing protein [Oscillatoria princeps RMCB-10]
MTDALKHHHGGCGCRADSNSGASDTPEEPPANLPAASESTRYLPWREGVRIDLYKCYTLGEIFALNLRRCRLVALSACETGLTAFDSRLEEYIGFPTGFLYAGAVSVVCSLWRVSDLSILDARILDFGLKKAIQTHLLSKAPHYPP